MIVGRSYVGVRVEYKVQPLIALDGLQEFASKNSAAPVTLGSKVRGFSRLS